MKIHTGEYPLNEHTYNEIHVPAYNEDIIPVTLSFLCCPIRMASIYNVLACSVISRYDWYSKSFTHLK